MSAAPGDALLARLLGFGRTLRRLGLDVHTGRMLDVVEALACVDISRRDDVFHVCRSLLVHRHEDLEPYDRAFESFWASAADAPASTRLHRSVVFLPSRSSACPRLIQLRDITRSQ